MEATISGSTTLLCLLGHPVAHSISPLMHNTACRLLGLDYAYLAFDVSEETFPEAIRGLRAMNCRGFNLTMPFKTTILSYLDDLSPTARLCGSVNTVVNESGRLIGHSTDGSGYMASIRQTGCQLIGENMTLLGSGGAAASICVQAAMDGVKNIFVFQRKGPSFDRAATFCEQVNRETSVHITLFDLADTDALRRCLEQSVLLVNATSVGMGDDPRSLVPKDMLSSDLTVSDIIYHPLMTTLLRDAADQGCRYQNGESMLLYQGAEAFRLWTGKDMPIDEIRRTCFCKGETP